MSEIRVTNVLGENGNSSVNFTQGINMSGIVTAISFVPTQGQLSHRNLIINGGMTIAQRGTSQSVTSATTYGVDRFFASNPTGSQVQTASQETDAPVGLYKSLKVTCTTANTNITSSVGDQAKIEYRIEGSDLAYVQLGTSNAQTLSVSFYVKSNKTGNSAIGLINYSNNRSFVHQFNIASADTWQRISFTVAGDTSGTWVKDTGIGMRMRWGSFGTNHQTGTFDAWQAGQFMGTSNSPINFNSATSDYLQITGVQVELGPVATPFEHRSIGDELRRCQRYFFIISGNNGTRTGIPAYANSTSTVRAMVTFPTAMRQLPSLTGTTTAMVFDSSDDSSSFNCNTLSAGGGPTNSNPTQMVIEADPGGMTAGQGGQLEFRATGSLSFSADL